MRLLKIISDYDQNSAKGHDVVELTSAGTLVCRYYDNEGNAEDNPFEIDVNFEKMDVGLYEALGKLGVRLQKDYQKNSTVNVRHYSKRGRSFTMEKQYFYIKLSKPIIDEIDELLAKHYGFTEEELDFIINYDIKYRMGDELNAE